MIYDKILEDEDKILLQQTKDDYSDDSSDSPIYESDLSSDPEMDLQTFTQEEFLNESTADFNKEIRAIN